MMPNLTLPNILDWVGGAKVAARVGGSNNTPTLSAGANYLGPRSVLALVNRV